MNSPTDILLAILILVCWLIIFSAIVVWAAASIIHKRRDREQHAPSSEGLLNPKHRQP